MEARPDAKDPAKEDWSHRLEQFYAAIGTVTADAPTYLTTVSMSVLDAYRKIIALKDALEHTKRKALTPYKPDSWEQLLVQFNLLVKYPKLPSLICHGFNVGIRKIYYTFTPPNSSSTSSLEEAYQQEVAKEFKCSRYIGPFTSQEVEEIIGPFQSSPLSLVPKPGKPGRFQAVHNFYFPHHSNEKLSSINHTIDSCIYPCTWGTFPTVCYTIYNLPPGSQVSVQDMAKAYRTIPVHPDQWPGLVVRLQQEDTFAINTNNNFGLSSAGGIYGEVGDAAADIFWAYGIGPLSKWVDDHIFFCIPHQHLGSYNKKQ